MGKQEHDFRVYWPHAARVDLTASFLPAPLPMSNDGSGWWSLAVPVPECECRYCFVIDGCFRVPDYSAGEPVYDSSGGLVSVIAGAPVRPAGAGRNVHRAQAAASRRGVPAPATASRGVPHRPAD
jgi:hypothetical protein